MAGKRLTHAHSGMIFLHKGQESSFPRWETGFIVVLTTTIKLKQPCSKALFHRNSADILEENEHYGGS